MIRICDGTPGNKPCPRKNHCDGDCHFNNAGLARRIVALFTTPPQRTWVGLTEDEATDLWRNTDNVYRWELIKRVEAMLKDKNQRTDAYLPSHTINAAKTVAVATDVYWQPIDTAPRGVKVQLLGKGNVATYGTYYGDAFWTHWCALPRKQQTTT